MGEGSNTNEHKVGEAEPEEKVLWYLLSHGGYFSAPAKIYSQELVCIINIYHDTFLLNQGLGRSSSVVFADL
jgi:hypothetical protein